MVATSEWVHGQLCVEDDYVGVAEKQIEAPYGTALADDLIPNVQIGESFFIRTKGRVLTPNPRGFGQGDRLYIDEDGVVFSATVNEVQLVTITATGGTFKLTFDDTGANPQQTAAIAEAATAATVLAALLALSNLAPGDVTVTGANGGPYTVTFSDDFDDAEEMTVDGASLTGPGAGATVTTLDEGGDSATAHKLGLVSEVPGGRRHVPTGKMRVDLDAKDSF